MAALEKKIDILSQALYSSNGAAAIKSNPTLFSDSASRYTQMGRNEGNGQPPMNQPVANINQPSPMGHSIPTSSSMVSSYVKSGPQSATPPFAGSPNNVASTSSEYSVPYSHKVSVSMAKDHPSVNGTPEDFSLICGPSQPTDQAVTRINSYEIREEMVSLWSLIGERSHKKSLNMDRSHAQIPSYETDIVSDGTITLARAEMRFALFRDILCKMHPIVFMDRGTSMEELRREKPMKFLAVMSTASLVISDPNQQDESIIIHNRAYEAVIYNVMLVGNKTFELLECLVLLTFWYNEPAFYHQLKCNLLTNLMVSTAVDLGLAGSSIGQNSPSLRYERVLRPQVLVDPTTLECRQIWLYVYCAAASFINLIRIPAYSLWTKYSEECCDLIEASSEIPVEQKRAIFFAKLARIFEEISIALYSTSNGPTPPSISDSRVLFLVRHFEERLKGLYEGAKFYADIYEPFYHAVQVYLHQLVIYVENDESLGRSPFSEYSLAVGHFEITADSVSCLSWCLSSSIRCTELFSTYKDEMLASLPVFAYSRLVYCVSMILKIHCLVLLTPGLEKICPVSSEHIGLIRQVSSRLDLISRKFAFSNALLSSNFIMKLLMVFFDRQIKGLLNGGNSGLRDQDNCSRRDSFLNGNSPSAAPSQFLKPGNPQGKPDSLPGSPLDILSSAAMDSRRQSQAGNINNMDTYSMKPKRQRASGSGDGDEDYPFWLMSDDFWKDIIPNIEAFTGYDVL